MLVVERHHIAGNDTIIRLCSNSKELYNQCNFLMRHAWFGGAVLPNINILTTTVKDLDCFKNLHNTKTAKQTVRKCLTDWTNFKKALNAFKKDPSKFIKRPKPPYYKDKLAQVIFYNETIKGGQNKKKAKPNTITPTNDCFGINSQRQYKQVILTPKRFGFVVDVQYEQPAQPKSKAKGVACVDIGLNNLAAITTDQTTTSILVNGRICKSINQKFNKHNTKRESQKRYFRLENYFHHVSKFIVAHCLKHGCGKIIVGKNDGWKSRMNLGNKTNQNFQYIPFWRLLEKIKYKAVLAGLEVVFTEEAYTSKASFLDRDPLPAYEKGVSHVFSGKRVKRGLYRSADGREVNADVNGSCNIGRKVIGNEDLFLRLDKSLAARPVRINPLKAFCV
jgi:putative transposase